MESVGDRLRLGLQTGPAAHQRVQGGRGYLPDNRRRVPDMPQPFAFSQNHFG